MLREILSLYKIFKTIPENERQVVFYSENRNYFVNYEGIINELLTNTDECMCYITSDANDPAFKIKNKRFKVFYIKDLLVLFMSFIKCRVLIMTTPDLNKYHIKRSSDPTVHYTYVFHSMVSTHMMYLKEAFDYYDSIMCVGPYQKNEIRKNEELNKLNNKMLVECGYYRLERIYRKFKEYKQDNTKDTTVLIAPSWGNKNILESCGEELVNILLDKGCKVIIRPHPETVKRNHELINNLNEKYKNNISFTLETTVESDDSLIKADVLICDCSGVALEYAFGTERPVLFIDVPYKIRNEEYNKYGIEPFELGIRDKIGVIVKSEGLENITTVIENLKADKDKYKEKITTLRETNIYNFNNSSKIAVKHINNLLKEKRTIERKG